MWRRGHELETNTGKTAWAWGVGKGKRVSRDLKVRCASDVHKLHLYVVHRVLAFYNFVKKSVL